VIKILLMVLCAFVVAVSVMQLNKEIPKTATYCAFHNPITGNCAYEKKTVVMVTIWQEFLDGLTIKIWGEEE